MTEWEIVSHKGFSTVETIPMDGGGYIYRNCPTDLTERMVVPGGWLYRTVRDVVALDGQMIAMVFVPYVGER